MFIECVLHEYMERTMELSRIIMYTQHSYSHSHSHIYTRTSKYTIQLEKKTKHTATRNCRLLEALQLDAVLNRETSEELRGHTIVCARVIRFTIFFLNITRLIEST